MMVLRTIDVVAIMLMIIITTATTTCLWVPAGRETMVHRCGQIITIMVIVVVLVVAVGIPTTITTRAADRGESIMIMPLDR